MQHRSRSHDAVIRVYDGRGNMIEPHEHKGRFQSLVSLSETTSRHASPRDGSL